MKKFWNFSIRLRKLSLQKLFLIGMVMLILVKNVNSSSPPFLKSLAVLFRARPPWPNIYSTHADQQVAGTVNQNHGNNRFAGFGIQNALPIPQALMASASANGKKGILIAQPMSARKPSKFQFLPQKYPHPPSHSYKIQGPNQFIPSLQITNLNTVSHAQRPQTQSHFTPIIATPAAPKPITVSETTTTTVPIHQMARGEDADGAAQERVESSAQTQMHVMHESETQMEIPDNTFKAPQPISFSSNSHFSKPKFENGGTGSSAPSDFRPSPMLSDSGAVEYHRDYSRNYPLEAGIDSKASSSFSASDAKDAPRFESGFKPVSYHQYASHYGTTASHEVYTNSYAQWNASQLAAQSTTPTSITPEPEPTTSEMWTAATVLTFAAEPSFPPSASSIEMVPSEPDRGRYYDTDSVQFGTTTGSSSERIEDWVKPNKKNFQIQKSNFQSPTVSGTGFSNEWKTGTMSSLLMPTSKAKQSKFPVYSKTKPHVRVRPAKCEQFHRYGFCPVSVHYPLAQVERIASRCSALLAHLIAPLPRTEVHYDIVMTRNTSRKTPRLSSRQKLPKNKGWSWKDFKGSPICDTEEIKITPGWAKNEDGEWLVILQTEIWKQEAQISICSFAHDSPAFKRQLANNGAGTKCVQRFTAQRLAVLDPENQERCPLIRSVFLPSACICLSEKMSTSSASTEDSTVGSVTPNLTSSEEDRSSGSSQVFGSREHRSFGAYEPVPSHGSRSDPILIQNGTFTTTLVVTENSASESMNSTPGP